MNVVWRAAEIIKQIGEITYYRSVVLADVEYAIDDGVYMWSGKKDSPYIGQISKPFIFNNLFKSSNLLILVQESAV